MIGAKEYVVSFRIEVSQDGIGRRATVKTAPPFEVIDTTNIFGSSSSRGRPSNLSSSKCQQSIGLRNS